MPCITVASLSYTSHRAIVGDLAANLGYEVVEPEVFREASAAAGMSEATLHRALQEPPSLFGLSEGTRKRAIAHVAAALAKHMMKDGVIYDGPFGHVLIPGVSHVLKVRIFAEREDRVANKVRQEAGTTAREAEKYLAREDGRRASLAKQVFGVDDDDANLFDLVVNTSEIDADTAVEIIANTVRLSRYQAMTYSLRCMENLELALRARACLVDLDPDVNVEADGGKVKARSRLRGVFGKKKLSEMQQRLAGLAGVEAVDVEAVEDTFGRAGR